MTSKWQTKDQLVELLCNLVQIPSVSRTPAEVDLPKYVVDQLQTLPYFQKHPDYLQLAPTGDGRFFVTSLVKQSKNTKKTLIMVSHFDVVNVEDYGQWKNKSFSPEELTELFEEHKDEMSLEVQQDIEQGSWLFGRGTMDMKCGLALHMSMLEQAIAGRFEGNLLLLTVPDEEVNSVGMRAAVPFLLELAAKHNLEYRACLNSEPVFTRYPGDVNNYIYTGTIGKIMPGYLAYGKETHVGEPFSGLNGNFMISYLNKLLELNTDFCEQVEGEVTPPPTNLLQKDLKKEYSVQTPHRAVTLFNLFTLEKRMDELIKPLLNIAREAAIEIEQTYEKRANQFLTFDPFHPPKPKINVLTYEDLYNYAIDTNGEKRVKEIEDTVLANKNAKDDRDITIELVDELSILCKELSPMIILFFAPPYYQAISSRKHPLIKRVVSEMIDLTKEQYGISLKKQHYFGGISDLSYVGLQYPLKSLQPLVANMPLWDKGYSIPLEELEQFQIPVLNFGPVGKDPHQWTERVYVDYSLGTLTKLLPICIEKLLADKND